MSGGIAIFVKTPGHSPLKTRLAATLGSAFAEQWHAHAAGAVAAVAREACRESGATPYWAVAEAAALADPRWAGLPILGQGDGGLGTRMHHVHVGLVERHRSGILLGADTPHLDGALLLQALRWLASPAPRLAIGPAEDGGFWLLGANRPLPRALWDAVPYSAPDTAQRFRAAFEGWGEWLELPRLGDVDTADDLLACHRALAALARPLPAQAALRAWMEAHAPGRALEA
jgi:glycosyltransferase A (GT-A) superfamily protein (DUF2064 family)